MRHCSSSAHETQQNKNYCVVVLNSFHIQIVFDGTRDFIRNPDLMFCTQINFVLHQSSYYTTACASFCGLFCKY